MGGTCSWKRVAMMAGGPPWERDFVATALSPDLQGRDWIPKAGRRRPTRRWESTFGKHPEVRHEARRRNRSTARNSGASSDPNFQTGAALPVAQEATTGVLRSKSQTSFRQTFYDAPSKMPVNGVHPSFIQPQPHPDHLLPLEGCASLWIRHLRILNPT